MDGGKIFINLGEKPMVIYYTFFFKFLSKFVNILLITTPKQKSLSV